MSNYTKSTNFTAKDSLPTGDTNKVIRGSEFDTEFDAIQTAIGTKADLAGPTFTGTATFANLTATGTVNFTGGSVTTNIDGGTIDGVTIGGSTPGAGTFSSLTATTADINAGTVDNTVIGGATPAAGTFSSLTATTANIDGGNIDGTVIGASSTAAISGTTGTFSGAVTGSNLNVSNWDTAFGWGNHGAQGYLTSVAFSDIDAGAVTLSSETFADSDTQIPTNAAVRSWVLTTYPTIVEQNDLTANVTWANVPDANITQSSVTQHQAALAIAASQLSDVTSTAAELNILDGVTATTAELNYVDGVTSNIQTQIDSINPSPTLTATASGALANGDRVIVNSNGTVSAVSGSTLTQTLGSASVFESASVNYPAIAYDSNAQKVLIAYRDQGNSNQGTAVVGTVSGTSISFGTPAVFNTYGVTHIGIAYDSNAQKFVIAYTTGDSNLGTGIVATISGTSVTFGSETTFDSQGNTTLSSVAYDENAQKVVIAYKDGYNNKGSAVVGTVSGTSISFGTKVVFDASNVGGISIAYDPDSQKVIIAYADIGSSNFGTSLVGTVSGTSISFGTAVVFESAAILSTATSYDTVNNKIVISYADNANSNHGTCIVGTVSGTSISYGTAVVFESASINSNISSSFHTAAGKVVIAYADVGNSTFGTVIVGTVSGTSISFETAAVFESANTGDIVTAYDANAEKVVIAYKDNGNSVYGTAVVFQAAFTSTNLTAENYIGISDAAYSDGVTATVQIVGSVDDAQSSLTAGQKYFVQLDGTLGLTAADPEVFAGTAVSATKLIVKG